MTLTLAEVAKLLHCSKSHISHLISGKFSSVPPLPVIRIGRRALVRRDAFDSWMLMLEAREAEELRMSGHFRATLKAPGSIAVKRMKG